MTDETKDAAPVPRSDEKLDALARAEMRYRLAAELAGHYVFEWNAGTERLEWSDEINRLLGYEPGGFPRDLAGYLSRIHPDDRERIRSVIEQQCKTMSPFDEEYRIQKNDGQYLHILSRARPVRNEQGIIERWVVVHADITEQRRAEAALREADKKFQTFVNESAYGYVEFDLEGYFTFANRLAEELAGYVLVPEKPLNFRDLLLPEDLGRAVADLGNVGHELNTGPREYRIRRKDGAVMDIQVNTLPLHQDGKLTGFQSTVLDITAHKNSEQEIKLSRERLRAQYNAIPVPTYTWQKEGDDFALVDYNAAAVAFTRGRIRDYVGIKVSELYADDPAIRADLERCFRERSSFERAMLYDFQSLQQQKYLVVKYAFVVPDQVIAHTEDQTEHWKALQALAELEERQREKLSAEVRLRRSRDYAELESAGADLHQFPSPAMRRVLEEAMLAARGHGNVLLLGNSGVGKTYLAGWIHQHSGRADGPFFDINCTTLAPSLIESELFGHEPGAFTGGKGRKRGLFELAHGGTLFLDEIGELPLDLQAKLLNFLDTREFMRVGGEAKIRVDARIIVATNRDLASLVGERRFREDLYYRLNVLAIMVPPLKERKQDIPLLAAAIMEKISRDMGLIKAPELGREAMAELMHYDWPGNVRELRNILERVILRGGNRELITGISELKNQRKVEAWNRETTARDEPTPSGPAWNFNETVDQYMKKLIWRALSVTGSRREAAGLLGISRHALLRYIKKFGINTPEE